MSIMRHQYKLNSRLHTIHNSYWSSFKSLPNKTLIPELHAIQPFALEHAWQFSEHFVQVLLFSKKYPIEHFRQF